MNKLCTKDHEHANLQGKYAKRAAIYPEKLCISILRGIRQQLQENGLMSLNHNEAGTVCEDRSEQHNEYLEYFVDDVSGAALKSHLVREARDDEVRGIDKCKVWDKVPISECYTNTGKAPVGTRWIDINKGDE